MNISKKVDMICEKNPHLLLIIGTPGSGKSKSIREYSEETGVPILDLDTIFAHTPSWQLMEEMKKFLSTYHQKVLLLDNKKILYSKDSTIDMFSFLKDVSEIVPVVATWNGKIEDGQLFHFRKDTNRDLIYPVNDSFLYVMC